MHHEASLSASEIINVLGGATALSRRPELAARAAITNWYKFGIPAKYWPALARIASNIKGAEHITIEALERHTHPVKEDVA